MRNTGIENCSTVIIGKNASRTGHILIGHNEDDRGCTVQCHRVPRRIFAEEETVVFEENSAIIPQVRETLAFYWSEVRCEGGISFADCFINEYGVVIVSDSCRPSKDAYGTEGENREYCGLGYGLRRIAAERAHTAREAVQIAGKLIETFGYFSSRTYHFADAEEAWCLSVPKGFQWAARRIKEDEIYFIPNHFQIHEVPKDDPNYMSSPDVIAFAREQGWFTGKDEDFDFADAYQLGENSPANIRRSQDAWKLLCGLDLKPEETRITALRADRLYGIEDIIRVLRNMGEDERDLTNGGTVPIRATDAVLSVCNAQTVESTIFDMDPDPLKTVMYKAVSSPDCSPFVPWFPLSIREIPAGYEYTSLDEALTSHFSAIPASSLNDPEGILSLIKDLQDTVDEDYAHRFPLLQKYMEEAEKRWFIKADAALALSDQDPYILRDHTITCAEEARTWLKDIKKAILR